MATTDLKFFTNEPERDLYSRFAAILKSNTQFFDALVGYFRTSGFFRLYESLETVDKIRILVGLNVDKFTVKIIDRIHQEVKFAAVSSNSGKKIIGEEIEKEFEQAPTSEAVEKGVRVFIDWLKSGKLEMRMYTEAPIHAKVYIMRKDPAKVPDTFGSVITGSSNFSEAGLVNNLEFNVELKDAPDVKFALKKFEELWAKATDIKDTYIEAVEQRTWMRSDITPYQLYLKTLYEFFKEEINSDKENFETVLPEGYMRLQYQIDAVMQARQKLDAYNGVFISDVVGLGKTYICAMLANTFNRNTYKLFICPPVLVDYWRSVLQEFDVARCDVESLGKLDKIIAKGTDKYTYIFVDEAHRFRNSNTESFTLLHQICRDKKVVLISATPINNYTSDIENQLYLFQAKQSGTINGIRNIEGFFRGLNSKLNKLPKGSLKYMKQLRENSEVIRDKLLREVMIRRTRGEIQQYYRDDLQKQGLTFPKVGNPEKIIYTFDEYTDEAFNETMKVIRDFRYSRYTPLLYLKDKKKYATMLTAQRNMGGFMKGILIKRLESSFYAFRKSLERFIESYEKFIDMVKTGEVYISKKVDVYDLLDDGNLEKLMFFIEQNDVMKFKSTEFEPRFIKELEHDLGQLKYLQTMWSLIEVDPKLDEFRLSLIHNSVMKGKKIIVFTESKETAEYLCAGLKDLYGDRIIFYSGQSSASLKVEIEDSFNPKNKNKNNDKYDLLITTDVLAEGINLHRANVLVNYDLPWNPTRIMQRVGRINRVGTEFDRIYVFNFFPTAQSHAQIPMEDRILEKLQAFHDTLGEDIKYLSDVEEVSAKKLFADLNKDLDDDEEGSTNPELAYLAIIRQIRDNDPKLFAQIKRLPRKAKAGKISEIVDTTSTISFIRKGALKTFFISDSLGSHQLTFMEAIPFIKAEPDEPKVAVESMYYNQFEQNDMAFDDMLLQEEEVSIERPMVAGNDAKVIRLLRAMKSEPRLTDDQEEAIDKLISLWGNGEIPAKISKDVMKKSKTVTDVLELYYEIMKLVYSWFQRLAEAKRFPYSEKALEKAEKLYRVFCSPEDADYNIRKYDDSDEVEVMKEYPLFTEYRCKKCKTTFLMPPYLISRGRGCPVCELSMDVPERMMRMNPGYGFTREIKSFGDKNCIYHKGCGHVYLKSAWNFLWDNKRWDCDCKNHSKQRKCMSKKELQEKLRLDDYDILDYKYNNRSYLLKLKCRICGSVFERPFYYDNLNSTICPKCREKKKEDKVHAFDQRIYELTGGEYVRVSDYVNEGVPIKIMHRKCQNIIMCMPGGFLRKGYRCSCEKTILTKELMEEVFSVFVQNFDILDYDKKTRIYTIRFKNGEIKRLHKGLVYQEATCKCKPEYFDREKEPWNFHK